MRNSVRYLVKLNISLLILKFVPRTGNIHSVRHIDQNYELVVLGYSRFLGFFLPNFNISYIIKILIFLFH